MLDLLLELQTVLVFLVVFCVIVAYVKARPPSKNFPPGPPITPFMGNLKYVSKNYKFPETFIELRKKYGPIFSVQLGWYPHVIIADYKLIKEALVDNAHQFSSRATHTLFHKIQPHARDGIIESEGKLWKATRRLVISSLRDFGYDKGIIEERILTEIDVLLNEISKFRGEPFKFNLLFNKATANVVCAMLFGKRYDYNDPDYHELLQVLNFTFSQGFFQMGAHLYIPYALPLLFMSFNGWKGFRMWSNMSKFVHREIKDHRQKFDPGNVKDFVDVYLDAEQNSTGEEVYGEPNLFKSIMDLLLAGSETTSTTLLWAVLFMLWHPDIQEKCREEILQVLGPDTKPRLKDREKLPYTDAVICEAQRLGNIVPTLCHCTKGTVEFHGYTLPDKTIVTPDYQYIHRDPELWDNPEQFRPERFLDENNKVARPPYFMPFGIGPRSCAGEGLARSELFLFFTSLLQNYRFTCADRSQLPTRDDALTGATTFPPPYDVMANPVVN